MSAARPNPTAHWKSLTVSRLKARAHRVAAAALRHVGGPPETAWCVAGLSKAQDGTRVETEGHLMNRHRDRWGRHARAAVLVLPAVFAAGAQFGCAAAPLQKPIEQSRVDTGAGTLTAARKFLEGRWFLESFEVYPPGRSPVVVDGSGMLLYDDSGNLRMEIRANEQSSDLLRAAGIDIRDGVIATDGHTAIDLQHRTLTYVLDGQEPLVRGPLGMHRPRHWVVEGDTLILTTKDDAGNPLSVGRWKRQQ